MLGSPFFVKADAWVDLVKQVTTLKLKIMKKYVITNKSSEIINYVTYRCNSHNSVSSVRNFKISLEMMLLKIRHIKRTNSLCQNVSTILAITTIFTSSFFTNSSSPLC